jgi:uridine monophosphate synthetase
VKLSDFSESREILRNQVEIGERIGTSGIKLKSYIDCRPLIVDNKLGPSLAYDIVILIGDNIGRPVYLRTGSIGGATFAGAHLAQTISYVNVVPGIPWFAFHSKKNILIMPREKVEKCVLVDDVLTTGSTFKRMIPAVQEEGIQIQGIFVLVDRREQQEPILDIPVYSIARMTPEGKIYE